MAKSEVLQANWQHYLVQALLQVKAEVYKAPQAARQHHLVQALIEVLAIIYSPQAAR